MRKAFISCIDSFTLTLFWICECRRTSNLLGIHQKGFYEWRTHPEFYSWNLQSGFSFLRSPGLRRRCKSPSVVYRQPLDSNPPTFGQKHLETEKFDDKSMVTYSCSCDIDFVPPLCSRCSRQPARHRSYRTCPSSKISDPIPIRKPGRTPFLSKLPRSSSHSSSSAGSFRADLWARYPPWRFGNKRTVRGNRSAVDYERVEGNDIPQCG